MIADYSLRLLPPDAADLSRLRQVLRQEKGIDPQRITHLQVVRRSIDARQRTVYVNLLVRVYVDEAPPAQLFPPIVYRDVEASAPAAVVVGAGPAGLFAALRLLQLGVRPIVLERGKDVHERRRDIASLCRDGEVKSNSNYCFGEGGAGAFSDGKLYTRSKKRGSVERVLQVLCQHGAQTDILADVHPHIGSDRLPRVIENMRHTIVTHGGEVHFSTLMTRLLLSGDGVVGVEAHDMATDTLHEFRGAVVLATGHSARDVYRYLAAQRIEMEAKGIAVGVRLEHPAALIDRLQYHLRGSRPACLPTAEYTFVQQVGGRGVYSFCMCPGGVVIPSATANEEVVVNGMSNSGRTGRWSNSGMVVEVRADDVEGTDVLRVLRWQQQLEQMCKQQGGRGQRAPAQRMADFVNGRLSASLPSSSYVPGLVGSPLHFWLPECIGSRLREGFRHFGAQRHGFLTNEAIVIGVETRTSSPVRIVRHADSLQHLRIKGLYPCGEGAGYAGGIVSAAIDGERCAERLAEQIIDK